MNTDTLDQATDAELNELFARAKMVNERSDYGQGYGENRFGFCIGDRVWWVGIEGYGHDSKEAEKQKKLCREIVKRWNEPIAPLREALAGARTNK